ncbi:alpha/beta fold hydrolase [Legionella impletisoli]|uniref:Alpha/beta hydrolase n=1 Tax=Legionella impletisoli TaxID=343510 RepID=A0A917JNF6_9GAMM|nr:alpha/beta hydrolase [Legionella impletisoli]GGI76947.1 alpha/beta hydrolase [Legionella impletisoli]
MALKNYFWDENSTRYQLISSQQGGNYNWLFLPGGPGADSQYLEELAKGLALPGNTWLIDLPNNGSNDVSDDYDFNAWFELLLPLIKRFENPVLVGQSFGGMFPLLFPQLEKLLSGFVILNSSPTLWHETANRIAKEKDKPSMEAPLQEFVQNPNPNTFKAALMACAPYYFTDETLDEGKEVLQNLPFNYHAANWWQMKVAELNFRAEWIPQEVKTLIICGTEDCMTPPELFENDSRFKRNNIIIETIQNAGHMPWIDDWDKVEQLFKQFISRLKFANIA